MNPTNLYHHILRFFFIWLFPCVTKAVEQAHISKTASLATTNRPWYAYSCSIQLRSGLMIHKDMDDATADATNASSNDHPLVIIPTTIDLDILYIHALFAKQLESYPRIGLSFLLPYALQKNKQVSFPNMWGILAYMELYQSHTTLSTWGNRISIGAIKGGACTQVKDQPNYSIVGIKEITYHWLWKPSWQLNLSLGLLINWWTQNMQNKQRKNTTGHANRNKENELNHDAMKIAPLAIIGIRYITHRESLLRSGNNLMKYKRTKSRVDCSIAGNSRKLASTQTYHFIFRGSSLLSFAINAHSALLCSLELGYNWYKQALLANMLPAGGIEFTPLLGYEIRYGRYLLQLQLGCELTESQKPTINNAHEGSLSYIFNKRGRVVASIQYMLTERFFVGLNARAQETPALQMGLSWPSND